MKEDKMSMEAMLAKPNESIVIVGGRKGSDAVDVIVKKRRFHKVTTKNFCSASSIISILCLVIMVQVAGLVFLILDKISGEQEHNRTMEQTLTKHQLKVPSLISNNTLPPADYYEDYGEGDESTDLENMDEMQRMMFSMKPRCFSMCEPTELFFREDKLIKTVVVHDRMRPVRYYMFLFPEVEDSKEDLGQPLLLTPLLEAGRGPEARELSRVRGLSLPRPVESYSGFFTVNATANSNLFFWFFPAQNGNSSAPLILWLQGGPGASSMFGVLKEHGPFIADVDMEGKPTVKHNPYSWNGNYSVLYVDNPVGTGFSYTDDPEAYPNFVEESSQDLYNMLQQFYQLFPDLVENQFFPMGESYGGKYVPSLAHKIHQENEKQDQPQNWTRINLAGLGMGNGWMSPLDQGKYASYLFFHGLLDKFQYHQLDAIDGDILNTIAEEKWLDAWQASDHQLNYILTALNYSNLYDLSKDQYRPSTMNFWHWLNQDSVRSALHVGNRKFSDGLQVYMAMIEDTMRSVKPYLEVLLPRYRVLAYHGSLDIICHYPGAEDMFSRTSWTGHTQFMESHRRPLWVWNQDTEQQELAGFVKEGGTLRLVLVRNAGHSVPLNQPQWTLRLLEEFVSGRL